MTLQPAPDLGPPADPGNHACEEGLTLTPRFDGVGLLPAIVTDAVSGVVLMLAWMNAESLRQTLASGDMIYWSRSRKSLWVKGETSGNKLEVVQMFTDCDDDTVLLKVKRLGEEGAKPKRVRYKPIK